MYLSTFDYNKKKTTDYLKKYSKNLLTNKEKRVTS